MRLEKLQIENFRACKNVTVNFDDYTCMVRPNGSGKSTVLTALNILFRDPSCTSTDVQNLTEEDFFNKDTNKPVVITATFGNLSAQAKDDLKHYVRQDKLIMKAKAEWNPDSSSAEVMQIGARNVISDFSAYFKSDDENKLVAKLRKIYAEIRNNPLGGSCLICPNIHQVTDDCHVKCHVVDCLESQLKDR